MTQTTCTCGGRCQPGSEQTTTTEGRSPTGPAQVAGAALATRTVTRRGMLTGSAAVVAGLALAGCSSDDPGTTTDPAPATTSAPPTSDSTAGGDPSPTASETPTAAATGERLISTSDLAVGGGAVLSASAGAVVVTHPADGEFKAFSAKCSHQGCPVSSVEGNTITCNCHGSTFDAATGDRTGGPAMVGLTPVDITVDGDAVYLT